MSEHDPYSRVEYRKLIAWPSRIRREWPLLEEVLSSGPSRRVLELGTGPGQHARALAEAGFQVVAVDRSEAQLAAATEEPVPAGLRFVRGDMVEVDRLVEGPFGAALCLGNTLPHLESAGQLTAFAAALARVLEPGAPLLLQILNYDRIHDQRIRTLPVNVRPLEGDAAGGKAGRLHGGGGGTGGAQGAGKDGGKRGGTDGGEHGAAAGRPPGELVFLRVMDPLPDGRVRFYPTTLELRPGADPPMAVKHSREVLLRGWRHAEVAAALAAAGLEPERALGDFDATPFDPATSHDLVLVARRR